MADIFLSYARADQPRVERLAAALEEAGYSLWWDKHLTGGKQFGDDIEAAIAEAKAVLVVWSKDAIKSEWVRDEAAYGRDHDKLVPVRIDETMPPMGYRQRHVVDLSHDNVDSMAALTTALDAVVGGKHEAPVPASTPASPRKLLLLLPVLLALLVAGWWFTRDGADADTAGEAPVQTLASVAVLPFIAQSSGEDDQYFADGLTEEILNRLDALQELQVVPRTTAFTYRDSEQPLNAIAEELKVGNIVEGSLRRDGDRVRVTARLVDAASERTIWSHKYDATVDDVFKVQADIAQEVASALDVLLDATKMETMASVGIDNPEAYALFAKAGAKFDAAHEAMPMDYALFGEGVALMDQALELEPKFAFAQMQAADYPSHMLLDGTVGKISPVVPRAVWDNAAEDFDRRLRLAAGAAKNEAGRLSHEILRQSFSDDWSRIPEMSRRFYALHDQCAQTNWPAFGYMAYGHGDEILDGLLARQRCYAYFQAYYYFVALAAIQSDRIDEAIGVVREGAELVEGTPWLEFSRILLLIAQDRRDDVRRLDAGSRHPRLKLFAAAYLGDRKGLLPQEELMRAWEPSSVIQFLALFGEQRAADELAAQIDARPVGPTVLQLAVDECLCGAPFDISRTPNFRKRLGELGAQWPPKAPIDWPLKKEPGS